MRIVITITTNNHVIHLSHVNNIKECPTYIYFNGLSQEDVDKLGGRSRVRKSELSYMWVGND